VGPRVQCAKPNGAWANYSELSERNFGNDSLFAFLDLLLESKTPKKNKILSEGRPQTGVLLCRHKEPAVCRLCQPK